MNTSSIWCKSSLIILIFCLFFSINVVLSASTSKSSVSLKKMKRPPSTPSLKKRTIKDKELKQRISVGTSFPAEKSAESKKNQKMHTAPSSPKSPSSLGEMFYACGIVKNRSFSQLSSGESSHSSSEENSRTSSPLISSEEYEMSKGISDPEKLHDRSSPSQPDDDKERKVKKSDSSKEKKSSNNNNSRNIITRSRKEESSSRRITRKVLLLSSMSKPKQQSISSDEEDEWDVSTNRKPNSRSRSSFAADSKFIHAEKPMNTKEDEESEESDEDSVVTKLKKKRSREIKKRNYSN